MNKLNKKKHNPNSVEAYAVCMCLFAGCSCSCGCVGTGGLAVNLNDMTSRSSYQNNGGTENMPGIDYA